MKSGAIVANGLTVSRFPIGIAVGILLYQGCFKLAFGLYGLGLLTDVLDRMVARATDSEAEWSKPLDRRMDMCLNAFSAAGYIAGAYWVWGDLQAALALLLSAGGLFVFTLPFFERDSAASKLRSGAIRIILAGFIAWHLQPRLIDLALVLLFLAVGIPSLVFEWDETKAEIESGERRWFKSPLPRAT